MFFDDLDFLVSPITGKRKLPKGQIYQGNDDGIEEASNALGDLEKLIKDLQDKIKKIQDAIDKGGLFPKDATFLLKKSHEKIPNALVVSDLNNGVVFKKEGGELEGKARVSVSNLPNPGVITIAGINVPVPKIFVGTKNEDMEASSVLGEMMAENLLNVNRVTFPGVLISGPTNMLYPSSTFISEPGIVLYRDKKFSAAVGGTDFVDVEDGLDAGKLCVIKDNSKFIGRTTITIVDGEHIRDVLSVSADVLNAKSAVNCEDMIVGRKEVVTDGILAVYDPSLRLTLRWGFKGPRGLARDLIYTPPNKDGNDGDCLATDGNLNLKWVKSGESILDGLDTGIVAFDKSIGNSKLINATLQQGKVWVGNEANKPKQVDFKIASPDATFILQTNFNGLNKAQALDTLGGGMLKADTTGKISIAKAGKGLTDDYVDPNALKEALDEKDEEFKKIKEDCEKSRDDAKDSKDKAEEVKKKVDETKEKIDEIKTQIDEKKTEIEEKIDEFKTELEESKAQIEEAQVACEEAQTEVTAAVAEMNATIAEANAAIASNAEVMADAEAASAASAAAAAGSAAAAAFLIGDVKNKEDKSSHKKDIDHVNGRIDDLQTEVNKKNNIAIHGTPDEVNVVNSYDSSTKTNNFTISLVNKSSTIEIIGTDKQVIVNKQDNNRVISLDEDLLKNISLAYDFSSKFALTSKDNSITINGLDITVNDRILNVIEEIQQSLQVFANSKDIVIGTHEDGRLELRFSQIVNNRLDGYDTAINSLGTDFEQFNNSIHSDINNNFNKINITSKNDNLIVTKGEPYNFILEAKANGGTVHIIGEDNRIEVTKLIGMDLVANLVAVHPELAEFEETLINDTGYVIDIAKDFEQQLNDKIDDFGNKASKAIASTQNTVRETFNQLIEILNTKANKSDIQPSPSGDPEKFKEYITKIVEENTTQFIKADNIPILLDSSNKDFIKQIIVETLKEYKLIP